MYENYEKIRNEKGLRNADVSRGTGISKQVLSDWKRGVATPKIDKLQKIADFLGVPLDYLLTGKSPDYGYFLDPEVAEMAQELHDNCDLRILFDTTRKATKEDLQMIVKIAKRITNE